MGLAYYNEIDPQAAAWLRELIKAGVIAPGDVDTRDIRDVEPYDLMPYTQCHFFAGIGVWSYALRLAGFRDDRPVWTGSCPCQPFSAAGKGAGFTDERHLWPDWFHLITQCSPELIIGEQVASKDAEPWVDLVQADMEAMGYAFGAVPFPAAGVGAPNIRDRLYWVADSNGPRLEIVGQQLARQECATSERGRAIGGMAYDDDDGRQGSGLHIPGRGSREAVLVPGWRGEARGVGDSGGGGSRRDAGTIPGTQSALERGVRCLVDVLEPAGAVRGLADADGGHAGTEREQRSGEQRSGEQRQQSEDGSPCVVGPGIPGPTNGYWRAADWIMCRDPDGARWRPVEPGSFPLAHGAAARVGRLRGYGNAINAQAAAAFVSACLEI